MTSAFIGLGSNLGKRQMALRSAIDRLSRIPASKVAAVATFRETDPVDAPEGSPPFVNSAVHLQTDLSAPEILAYLHQIELSLGRDRSHSLRNAPRTIDLDLLLFGSETISTPELTVPHPRMHLRRFVLQPLAEIAPDFVHPSTGMTMRQLLERLGPEPASA